MYCIHDYMNTCIKISTQVPGWRSAPADPAGSNDAPRDTHTTTRCPLSPGARRRSIYIHSIVHIASSDSSRCGHHQWRLFGAPGGRAPALAPPAQSAAGPRRGGARARRMAPTDGPRRLAMGAQRGPRTIDYDRGCDKMGVAEIRSMSIFGLFVRHRLRGRSV